MEVDLNSEVEYEDKNKADEAALLYDSNRFNVCCPTPLLRCDQTCVAYQKSRVYKVVKQDMQQEKYCIAYGKCTNLSIGADEWLVYILERIANRQ